MDTREMNLIMNIVVYSIGKGMTNLIGDKGLVARQAGIAMIDDKASVLLKALGFPEFKEGESIDSIMNKIKEFLINKQVVQKFDIIKSEENSAVIEIRDCIFSQAARMARESNIQPICAIISLLAGIIRKYAGKEFTVKSIDYDLTKNTEHFEIEIAEF